MVYAKSLTQRIKNQRTPLLITRDYPLALLDKSDPKYWPVYCLFCGGLFVDNDPKYCHNWEHLDNNNENEELYNLVWVHAICNQQKKNDTDMQIYARELLQHNLEYQNSSAYSSVCVPTEAVDPPNEIELSQKFHQITVEFLARNITAANPRWELVDAIFCIVAKCRTATGNGSSETIRRHLKELTCSSGKYEVVKVEGDKFIQRRWLNGS